MQEDAYKRSIVDHMSLVRAHVEGRSRQGLTDAADAIEVLFREVLTLTRGWNLVSANFGRRNFPAVDLVDKSRRLAVQVTIHCSPAKIRKTQEAFVNAGLRSQFDKLYLVSFDGPKTSKYLAPYAELWRQDDLLSLSNLNLSDLSALDARLRASVDWHKFVQQSDEICFRIVMGVVNRDAIRHHTMMEGDFAAMLDAMTEIKQIINAGEVIGKKLYAKPMWAYASHYRDVLEDIDRLTGQMASIVRRHRVDAVILPTPYADQVDALRLELFDSVNAFCARQGVPELMLHGWDGRP